MNERDAAVLRRQQVLDIVTPYLDTTTLAIVESVLDADERMAVIRDSFLDGRRDHEAVQMIRDLDPVGQWSLLPCSTMEMIEPNQSAQITARPQRGSFEARHLLVSRASADFMLNDIRVNNRSQFMQSGDVPLDPFVVDAPALDVLIGTANAAATDREIVIKIDRSGSQLLGVRLDIERVDKGGDLVLVVTNIGPRAAPFLASWLGELHLARRKLDADQDTI